jgi:hypothetical protein
MNQQLFSYQAWNEAITRPGKELFDRAKSIWPSPIYGRGAHEATQDYSALLSVETNLRVPSVLENAVERITPVQSYPTTHGKLTPQTFAETAKRIPSLEHDFHDSD